MVYAVGYLRLSKEDEKEGESTSISNQRSIIDQYCIRNGIAVANYFVDDDYSGGNFNRPGFQQMLEYLKGHPEVVIVITKDLSRLGRDMSDSSYYAERYFPEHNIRYLAINDSFDSERENTLAPFQFAMNEIYLRDLSKKVKNAFHVMMNQGDYCFGAPYGYKKAADDNHRLIPDENAAWVVKRIFLLASQGQSTKEIAKLLTDSRVPPPLMYRATCKASSKQEMKANATNIWNSTTVRRILNNPVYLGNTVLGKTRKISPKSDMRRRIPESEWCVTEKTHEALVDKDTRDRAIINLAQKSSDYRQCENARKSIFRGIVFCSTCGAAMCSCGTVYGDEPREKYWYLACQNIPVRRGEKQCPDGARIKYHTLINIVETELRALFQLTPEQRTSIIQTAAQQNSHSAQLKDLQCLISAAQRRINTIENVLEGIYEDMYTGIMPRDRALAFIEKKEGEKEKLKQEIAAYKATAEDLKCVEQNYESFFRSIDAVENFSILTRELLIHFIERIEIGPKKFEDGRFHGARSSIPYTQEIKIYYKFIGSTSFLH